MYTPFQDNTYMRHHETLPTPTLPLTRLLCPVDRRRSDRLLHFGWGKKDVEDAEEDERKSMTLSLGSRLASRLGDVWRLILGKL